MHSFDDFFRLQVIMIQLSSRSLLRNLLYASLEYILAAWNALASFDSY